MNLNKFLNQRIKKMALTIGVASKKILKKEFKKMQKELIKGVLKNDKKTRNN